MNLLVKSFLVSLTAILKVLAGTLVGIVIVRFKFVPKSFISQLTTVIFKIFLPSLLFLKVGRSTSIESLATYWTLPLFGALQIVTGFVVGSLLFMKRWGFHSKVERRILLATVMFGNAGYIPFVFLGSLCAEERLFGSYAKQAADNAVSYTSIYMILISLSLWTVAFNLLPEKKANEDEEKKKKKKQDIDDDDDDDDNNNNNKNKNNSDATADATEKTTIEQQQQQQPEQEQKHQEQGMRSTTATTAVQVNIVNNNNNNNDDDNQVLLATTPAHDDDDDGDGDNQGLIMQADGNNINNSDNNDVSINVKNGSSNVSPSSSPLSLRQRLKKALVPSRASLVKVAKQVLTPPTVAVFAGFATGLVKPLKEFLIVNPPVVVSVFASTCDMLGAAVFPAALMVLGGNLAGRPDFRLIRKRGIALSILGRLVIGPALGMLLAVGALKLGILPKDPVFLLEVMVQASTPVATNLVLMAQMRGAGEKEMSTVMFFQYLCGALSMPLFTTLFLVVINYYYYPNFAETAAAAAAATATATATTATVL